MFYRKSARLPFNEFQIYFTTFYKNSDVTEHFFARNARFRGQLGVCIPMVPQLFVFTILHAKDIKILLHAVASQQNVCWMTLKNYLCIKNKV